ncbi:MAG: HAD family hydrolase [Patescibacteria group bacterium]
MQKNFPEIEGIMIDFDGTIAGKTHEVSPRVKEAIRAVKGRVKVSLCTGRPVNWVRRVAEELGLTDSLHVADGGGRVIDGKGNVVWERFIPTAVVHQIAQEANRRGFEITAQIDGDDVSLWNPPAEVAAVPALTHILFRSLSRSDAESFMDWMASQHCPLHIVLSHYRDHEGPLEWLVDVTAQGANKQHALLHLAGREGLNLKKFMGIGDGYNDFPLLLACGFKVAMGNAPEELKAIADYVAPSVDEDGVAEAIEKYILNVKSKSQNPK